MPEYTPYPNPLVDAVLRLKCPAGHKELLFAIVRLMNRNSQSQRALSLTSLAKFLRQDKSNIAKRLNALIACNVLKETRRPGYTAARQLVINYNYSEWRAFKIQTVKIKKYIPDPPLGENERSAPEGNPEAAVKSSSQAPESAAVVKPTTPPVPEPTAASNFFQNTAKSTTVVKSTTPSAAAAAGKDTDPLPAYAKTPAPASAPGSSGNFRYFSPHNHGKKHKKFGGKSNRGKKDRRHSRK